MDTETNTNSRVFWEKFAEIGNGSGVQLRDGRTFEGWILDVGDDAVLVQWRPSPFDDEVVDDEEWIAFASIDPNSLIYWDESMRLRRYPSGKEYELPQSESMASQNEPSVFLGMSACLLAYYTFGIFGFAFLHVYVTIGPPTGSLLFVLQIVLGVVALLFATLACVLMGFSWEHWCNRSVDLRCWLIVAAFWSSVVLLVSVK